MNTAFVGTVSVSTLPASAAAEGTSSGLRQRIGPLVLAILLVLLAVVVYATKPYEAGSDLGYTLGLLGGVGMLTLMLYPLRKRSALLQRLGGMQGWFNYHVAIGIAAPTLIIFHSTLRPVSINGTAAYYAMLMVVASGIVGRYVYRHVHLGLSDRLMTLADADKALKSSDDEVRNTMARYPDVGALLEGFRLAAFCPLDSKRARVWRFITLPVRGYRTKRLVENQIRQALRSACQRKEITPRQARYSYGLAKTRVGGYVSAVCDAAQLKGWERLFSLWHIAHLPFIYLLLFSGIVHVVAVHAY